MDLSRVNFRDGLKHRAGREPHWQRIRVGCFIGYRPSKKDGAGTWLARIYDEETGKYRRKALGDFGALAPRDRFTAAKKEAEQFADLVETGGFNYTKIESVADACRSYAADRRDAESRFKRFVYDDPIAKVKLDKLRRRHLKEWRQRLEKSQALVSRNKQGPKRYRERSRSTINRDMVPLRAALFSVLAPGAPGTEAAWQEALVPNRNANTQRTRYLDLTQRRLLISHVSTEATPFVKALCLLPLRPGAMASLSAGDYDRRTRELTIGKDKSGKPRRIIVPKGFAAFIEKQMRAKLPTAPLFMRANGKRWCKETWNQPIAKATKEAKLLPGITSYTLRHSVITDLVNDGLPILTVAQISDTSVEMIERHYGHLNQAGAEQALARLAL